MGNKIFLLFSVVAILLSADNAIANLPPVSEAGSYQTVAENQLVTLDASGSYDPDGDILYYRWDSNEIALEEPNEKITFFTAPAGIKLIKFTLTVRDRLDPAQALWDSDTVLISINQRPVAVAKVNKAVVNEISDFLELDGSYSYDPDDPHYDPCDPGRLDDGISLYRWLITEGPSEVMNNKNAYLEPDEGLATTLPTATFTPPQGIAGSGPKYVTFKLEVTDQTQFPNENKAQVTVRINRLPTAMTNDNQHVTEGDTVYLVETDSFDIDGIGAPEVDSISYHWQEIPESTVLLTGPGDISRDGKVNFADLEMLAEQWLQPPGTPSADIGPQPNGDGVVNFLDFAVLAKDWFKPTSFVAPDVESIESLTFRLTVTDTKGLQDWEDVTISIEPFLPDILYVDKANQDGPWNGSENYPYKTIQDALDEANTNSSIDTIEVRVSNPSMDTYTEDVALSISGGFPDRDHLTLRAQEVRDAVTHRRMNIPTIKGRITMGDSTHLEGFRIEKGPLGAPLVLADSVSGVEIAHNKIMMDAVAPSTTIKAVDIIDPQFTGSDIINVHNNVVITNVTGTNCKGIGISLTQTDFTQPIPENRVKIKNNSIDISSSKYACGLYIEANNYYEETTYKTGIVVENNIISVPRLSNGVIFPKDNNINYCIDKKYSSPVTYVPVKYNDRYVRSAKSGDIIDGAGVLTYPEFFNKSANPSYEVGDPDYHLDTRSPHPCIDTGNPNDDYSQEPQPNGNRINMGAYGNTPEAEAAVKVE